jgi:hypothetical protein
MSALLRFKARGRSYFYAHEERNRVAAEMGNSPQVVFRHYRALVKRAEHCTTVCKKSGGRRGPFVNLPEKGPGRWRQGITPRVMKRCVWIEPVLVAQIKFTEWTSDGQLRQPVFLRLRSDKDPKEVVRE